MRRFFKVKNFFLISFLAVAGIFSAGAFALNKQAEETPVVEKVEATTYNPTFEGKSGDILYVKGNKNTYFPGQYYCAMHLWGGNSGTAADNDIYVCNDNYAPYNNGNDYYFALRVPFGTGGVSVTYTKLQICRQTPSKKHDNYTSEINIATAIKNKPTNLLNWTGWGSYTVSATKYTHYGVKSGDHVYVDASLCPGWIDASSTDNTHITIFVTATNGNDTYIYLWGGANDSNKNAAWPGIKIYEQGAWVYNNGSSQGVAAVNIDRSLYQHMIINHNNGNQTNTYDFVDGSKYLGFYFNGNNQNVGTWNAGSDYSTNAKIGVYFSVSNTYNGDAWGVYRNGSSYVTAYARKVEGKNNKYLYEVLAPQQNNVDVVWNLVIVGRFKSTSASPTWDDKLHQKSDFYYTSALNSYNEFKINGWIDSMYTCSDTITTAGRADYYGSYMLSQMTCDGHGNRTYTDNVGLANAKNEYKKYLSNEVQYYLWETKASEASGYCRDALERYDYIFFFKQYYELDDDTYDFINRHSANSGKTSFSIRTFSPFELLGDSENGGNISTIIIIVASSVALLSITALSVLMVRKRKRKEN